MLNSSYGTNRNIYIYITKTSGRDWVRVHPNKSQNRHVRPIRNNFKSCIDNKIRNKQCWTPSGLSKEISFILKSMLIFSLLFCCRRFLNYIIMKNAN